MKDKLSKLYSVLRKYGLRDTLKKMWKYFYANYGVKLNLLKKIRFHMQKEKLEQELSDLLENGDYERIILWMGHFGWNVPLFQRPQQIAIQFSKQKCLVFYEITSFTDSVDNIKKQEDNLYLVNFENSAWRKMFLEKLKNVHSKPKYLQFYSTDWNIKLDVVKQFIKDGYTILYEYIDELSPELSGTKELPINVKQKYDYMLQDTKNVVTVVTADEIKKDVENKRGIENLVFACNGVDYSHFAKIQNRECFSKEFSEILEKEKPIIGYYGALASWVDYEMLKCLARKHLDYSIVLFGAKYDDSMEKSEIEKEENIYFLR